MIHTDGIPTVAHRGSEVDTLPAGTIPARDTLPKLGDAEALDRISAILDCNPWPSGADVCEWVAEIIADTGRPVGDNK